MNNSKVATKFSELAAGKKFQMKVYPERGVLRKPETDEKLLRPGLKDPNAVWVSGLGKAGVPCFIHPDTLVIPLD